MAGPRAGNSRANGAANGDTSNNKQSLTEASDKELYGGNNGDYVNSIAVTDNDDDMDDVQLNGRSLVGQYTASKEMMNEFAHGDAGEVDILDSREKQAQIASRETDYQRRRFDRALSPARADPFAKDGEDGGQSYKDVMKQRELEREEARVKKLIEEKEKSGGNEVLDHKPTLKDDAPPTVDGDKTPPMKKTRKRRRWDEVAEDDTSVKQEAKEESVEPKKRSRWSPAPEDPKEAAAPARSRWDTTAIAPASAATPAPATNGAHPVVPTFAFGTDISNRNAPLSDEQLDMMLPGEAEGYKVLDPPPGYEPVRRPVGIPALPTGYQGFLIPEADNSLAAMGKQLPTEIPGVGDLQF